MLTKGAHTVIDNLHDELVAQGLIDEVQVLETSRIGDPGLYGPDFMVYPEGVHYVNIDPDDIPFLVEEHFLKGRVVEKFRAPTVPQQVDEELGPPKSKEVRNVLRNCGKSILSILKNISLKMATRLLGQVLSEMTPEQSFKLWWTLVCAGEAALVSQPEPNGRWLERAADTPKYVICNADEGDPGAFMNRRVLESDPHALIEGMIIAAYAIGASRGYIYCRAEYPLAVKTLNIGILQAREMGLLGENILAATSPSILKFAWALALLFAVKKPH
jgi:(2Fe-2S) ferredoxin